MKTKLVATSLALSLLLLGPTIVLAAAVKVPLKQTDPPKSEVGFVIVNNPRGKTDFILQVSLKGAYKANWDHYVYIYDKNSGKYLFYLWPEPGGILHTNKKGNGNFHLNGNLEPGSYKLMIWINEEPTGHSYYVAGPIEITVK